MVFVTCGLGGGTGSGASPVVASIARDIGALTIAVVTKPFSFEGSQRRSIADQAYDELANNVDTIITIANDRILQIVDKKMSLSDSFRVADEVLRQGVEGIADLITMPGLVNVDFADVRAIMQSTGTALMGIGRAAGENRSVVAAKAAISSPLLDTSIDGARGLLFVIAGGPTLTMHEVNEAAKVITSSSDENAKVIFGAVIDENLRDEVKVTVIATGFSGSNDRNDQISSAKIQSYTPNRLLERQQAANDLPEAKPTVFDKKISVPTDEKISAVDEDLDIPAFIRKKMQ